MWYYCRVTRMLVSYDVLKSLKQHKANKLQGHQNVGELRQIMTCSYSSSEDCRVTRMLVSYDSKIPSKSYSSLYCRVTRMLVSYDLSSCLPSSELSLQGHQNVGELRLIHYSELIVDWKLQGHQNVGELRHLNCCSVSYCNCFAFKM